MSNSSENSTGATNGTEIIIKQVFLTVNPDVFVKWDDLFNMILMWALFYYVIRMAFKLFQRQKQQIATAVIVQDDEGAQRVVMGS